MFCFDISVCAAGHGNSADDPTCTLCADTQYKANAGDGPCDVLPDNSQSVASRDDFGMHFLKCPFAEWFYVYLLQVLYYAMYNTHSPKWYSIGHTYLTNSSDVQIFTICNF